MEAKKQSEQRQQRIKKVKSLIVKGLTNKEISQKVGISESTVNAYIMSMFDKYKCENRTQLAVAIAAKGL